MHSIALPRTPPGLGHECIVVARADELTNAWVPDDAHEAMRDLIRARATAVRVPGKATHSVVVLNVQNLRTQDLPDGAGIMSPNWITEQEERAGSEVRVPSDLRGGKNTI